MITKPVSLIVATGRTGTRFLGLNAHRLIQDCCSDHEPDVIMGFTRADLQKVLRFGPYNTVIGRGLGLTGLRNYGRMLHFGEMTPDTIAKRIVNERRRIYTRCKQKLFIESNPQWALLLPTLDQIFSDYVVAGIVRHPYDFIGSMADHAAVKNRTWYGLTSAPLARRRFHRVGPGIENAQPPIALHGDHRWHLAWSWQYYNRKLVDWIESRSDARLYRFEEIFSLPGRATRQSLLEFLARNPANVVSPAEQDAAFRKVANAAPKSDARDTAQYPALLKDEVQRLCGPLASKLGYSL